MKCTRMASEISADKGHVFFVKNSTTLNAADSDTKLFHYSVRCVKD